MVLRRRRRVSGDSAARARMSLGLRTASESASSSDWRWRMTSHDELVDMTFTGLRLGCGTSAEGYLRAGCRGGTYLSRSTTNSGTQSSARLYSDAGKFAIADF